MTERHTKHRMCRIVGQPMCGLDNCPAIKRPYAPGQHGKKRNLAQSSEFGTQLLEKQKLKFVYGLRERQFRRFYEQASRDQQQPTGDALLVRMETRLDNIVYRLGYARTVHAARQLVVHGHFTVDGQRVDRPSYCVPVGGVVQPTDRAKGLAVIRGCLDEQRSLPPYLAFDRNELTGVLLRRPTTTEVPVKLDMSRIVEYYARA